MKAICRLSVEEEQKRLRRSCWIFFYCRLYPQLRGFQHGAKGDGGRKEAEEETGGWQRFTHHVKKQLKT